MTFFSRLNPVPSFPAYSGPYKVGTFDYEVPVHELSKSISPPDPAITTIRFRLFYPCERETGKIKPLHWLPEPQGEHLRAFYRFCQATPWLATLLSHLCGSLASHGLVVVAPEHRDGSAPISIIKETTKSKGVPIHYKTLAHQPTPEVEEGRNEQLRIRCWELALVHHALLEIDVGRALTNTRTPGASTEVASHFQGRLDVHTPGRIAWAGHSFGATTTVQFIKSIFHGGSHLLKVPPESQLSKQITPSSSISLLDLWAMPLFPQSSSLWAKRLPAFSAKSSQSASPPLAILSEGFYKWSSNLRQTILAISGPESSSIKPWISYPVKSAHLSQSDFGILFPWLTKKALKVEEPERTLKLNVRAILESLRRNDIEVADTSQIDMETADELEQKEHTALGTTMMGQDHKILAADGGIRGWIAIDPDQELQKRSVTLSRTTTTANGDANIKTPNGSVANGSVTKVKAEGGPGQQAMKKEMSD
ncbi:uncharacterized protein KY384_001629 [Bacidia gigantensis]|uniref:uncharacterized protein n=1 Tax=Bacidia gigantensis TaxID=2732470 RepID=UPI001D04DD6D|nr:uncharacterized protein KY384_001629 [Bacidia gigantensis]KAG8533888.1 hypothetical protein KY384_001629 [Bacidia gigantensis]